MFQMDHHRTRSAQLIREAQEDRLAREAARARRTARKEASGRVGDRVAESHTDRPRRHRLPRTA
ncbi:hypothetical protein SAMN05428944_2584 [Streptomyces sp. 1222.5]|uniref:hypothetical protein n=1 Tax=unclassified Streptomyces TaxID=2593676 RepID=UPI000896FB58|nr:MULTISPECIES: hypothetical protein [unclassified Streptomyces]PKW10235.1 hypothetical protein BX260_5507 [Streptomyces sp. 5112.2]SEC11587.1 hypothetical protein SAMN05428944_2584 [Streptomyces sp. 1222.5]SED80686.1 hypothetical protein SAMN05216532_5786 [Streptomyces sp. 2231.1]